MSDDLQNKLAALKKAGATPGELLAWLGNLQASAMQPQARDATNQPFHSAADARAAHQESAQAGMGDAGNMMVSGANAATFGLADEVVPGMKEQIQGFAGRKPRLDQLAQILGSLAGPGVGSLKAVKAIAPAGMMGQVATGAGIGGANALLAGAGNAEGDIGQRIAAGASQVPMGMGIGAAIGAVPGAVVKTMSSGEKVRQTVAVGRTAMRSLQGKPPRPSDLMAMLRATPEEDLATLMAKATGAPSPQIDPVEMMGLRRLSNAQPGVKYEPASAISPEALARKQRGRSQGAIDREKAHNAKWFPGKTKITKKQYDTITSNPDNLEMLLQLTKKRLEETGQAGSLIGRPPP
jgi:hypothetical protein